MTQNISETLAPFSFSAFRLTIRAEEPLHLPSYKGSALRGAFGHTLRRVICVAKKEDCRGCSLTDRSEKWEMGSGKWEVGGVRKWSR